MSSLVAWTRAVRYLAADGKIKYGELLDETPASEVSSLAESGALSVRECEGDSLLSARPIEKIEPVSQLLGPLTPQDVPLALCVGLNYKTHSKISIASPARGCS